MWCWNIWKFLLTETPTAAHLTVFSNTALPDVDCCYKHDLCSVGSLDTSWWSRNTQQWPLTKMYALVLNSGQNSWCESRFLHRFRECSQTSTANFKTLKIDHLLLLSHRRQSLPQTTDAWCCCPFFVTSFSIFSSLPASRRCDISSFSRWGNLPLVPNLTGLFKVLRPVWHQFFLI